MRLQGSVTSISWIPSEAMNGMMRVPMDLGIGHYDDPPPDRVAGHDELAALRDADRFRFANHLAAEIDVEDGRIVDARHTGEGMIGATTMRIVGTSLTIPAVAYPDRRSVEVGATSATFRQTAGGRTGAPMPRKVSRPPFLRMVAPTAWTTLELTLHVDGRVEHRVGGASPFPRHWIYDAAGDLVAKTGVISYDEWAREQDPDATPWQDQDREAVVTRVETALERDLSVTIMQADQRPQMRALEPGDVLVRQGQPGDTIFLLLDGLLAVDVDGEVLTEIGPGAILGERAVLEGGRRTATLTCLTPVRVAVVRADQVDRARLAELATHHRGEAPDESVEPVLDLTGEQQPAR